MTNSLSEEHIFEAAQDGFDISTDRTRLDLELMQDFLSQTYWAKGITREAIEKCVAGSLCFGLYEGTAQIGFARVVTDKATFAYLADVFVLPEYQNRGLGSFLLTAIKSHPNLQSLRRMLLFTKDSHAFYSKLGFKRLGGSSNGMQILDLATIESCEIAEAPEPQPYKPRQIEMMDVQKVGNLWLKRYLISTETEAINNSASILRAATEYAQGFITEPAESENRYGFLTLHFGEQAVWLLVDVWYDDILHHHLYFAPNEEPTRFRPGPDDGTTACIWELEITSHERNAWVKHVFADPKNPDYESYLGDSLSVPANS